MVHIHELGLQPYPLIWEQMRAFTQERTETTVDELWLLEHEPVYTQGQAGKAEHILRSTPIPIVNADRGGQVTYHGPGQLVVYCLLDLTRRQLGVRALVQRLETTLIDLLQQHYQLDATTHCGAPGVYVDDKKIASIGLRVKRGCAYHGFALNVDMDLTPFQAINPCGFKQLTMTQLADYHPTASVQTVAQQWIASFMRHFENTSEHHAAICSIY